jgi:hypothetical protein
MITVTADGECLTCYGFSLGESDHLGNFEFIANYFNNLSISPQRGNSSTAFMGSTRSGASTPWRAMIVDSAEEFLMTSGGERCSSLPSPRRHGTGASLTPVPTTPGMENAPAARATMMAPPQTWHHGRRPASVFGDVTLIMEGNRGKLALDNPSSSKR